MTKKKVFAVVLLCAVLVAAVVLYGFTAAREHDKTEEKSDAIIQINELRQQRVNLNAQISLLEKDKGDTDIGGAAVFLCFDNADRNLYEIIYPTLTYHGFRGIFTFQPGKAPNDDGILTSAQYLELLSADWSAAVKYSSDVDPFVTKARFEAMGLAFPEIMVFDEGEYSSSMLGTLEALGIKICICADDELVDDDMVKISSEPIMYEQSVVKLRVNKAMNDGTPLVVRTGEVKRYVDDRTKDCDLEKYEECLRWLKIMQNKKRLILQNTYDRTSVSDVLDETKQKEIESQQEVERLKAEIAEIDEQIEQIREGLE